MFSEAEVIIIQYFKTMTLRNLLQFDNSVLLVIFWYLRIMDKVLFYCPCSSLSKILSNNMGFIKLVPKFKS